MRLLLTSAGHLSAALAPHTKSDGVAVEPLNGVIFVTASASALYVMIRLLRLTLVMMPRRRQGLKEKQRPILKI